MQAKYNCIEKRKSYDHVRVQVIILKREIIQCGPVFLQVSQQQAGKCKGH